MKRTTLFFLLLLGAAPGLSMAQTPDAQAVAAERLPLPGEGKARVVLALNSPPALASQHHLRVSAAGTELQAGHADGTFTSQPIRIALAGARPFISAVPVWHGQQLHPTNLATEVRSSSDGQDWSEWQKPVSKATPTTTPPGAWARACSLSPALGTCSTGPRSAAKRGRPRS